MFLAHSFIAPYIVKIAEGMKFFPADKNFLGPYLNNLPIINTGFRIYPIRVPG
jgi:hypothetical protein